jgi:hypothetical protein
MCYSAAQNMYDAGAQGKQRDTHTWTSRCASYLPFCNSTCLQKSFCNSTCLQKSFCNSTCLQKSFCNSTCQLPAILQQHMPAEINPSAPLRAR